MTSLSMKLILVMLLLGVALAASSLKINYEGWAENSKIINGDGALEIGVKGSARLREVIPLKTTDLFYGMYFGLGFSETYTAPRSSAFSFNHAGQRMDWSIGANFGNIDIIYTHSVRNWFEGANPKVFFFNDDVDSLKLRYKGEFNL